MQASAQEHISQLFQSGQYAEALSILQNHLRAAPDDWHVHYLAGMACRFMGDFDKAVAFLGKATELNPGEASIFLALGIAYQLSGQFEQAITTLEHAIVCDENFIEAHNSLGLTYRKMGRFREALESYEEGTERLMELVSAEVQKDPSKCYRDEFIDGKATRTILPYVLTKTFELLKANLLYAGLRNNAGVCLLELGDVERARKLFQDAIECTPDGYDYPDPVRNLKQIDG
jgi:Flp pilus assembly protein TadD